MNGLRVCRQLGLHIGVSMGAGSLGPVTSTVETMDRGWAGMIIRPRADCVGTNLPKDHIK